MVFNRTFNNIYRGGQLYWLRNPEYLEKTTDLSQVTAGLELTTLMVICTDCIGSYKSNYYTIRTMTTPFILVLCDGL